MYLHHTWDFFLSSTFYAIIYLERLLLLLSPSFVLPFHLDNIHDKPEQQITVFPDIIYVMAQSLYLHQLSHKTFYTGNIKHQHGDLGDIALASFFILATSIHPILLTFFEHHIYNYMPCHIYSIMSTTPFHVTVTTSFHVIFTMSYLQHH